METLINNCIKLLQNNTLHENKDVIKVTTLLLLSDILLNPSNETNFKGFKYDKNSNEIFKKVRTQGNFLSQFELDKDDQLVKSIVKFHNEELDKELVKENKKFENMNEDKKITFEKLTEDTVKSFSVLEFISKFDK